MSTEQLTSTAAPPRPDGVATGAESAERPGPEQASVTISAKAGKSRSKGKRAAGDAQADATSNASAISIAAHPRARRMVRRAREVAGLAGFLIGGWLSLPTHTLAGALLSAIAAGVACQLVVWAAAVLLCGQLIVAEIRDREQALERAVSKRSGAGGGPGPPGSGGGRAQDGGNAGGASGRA